jgi:hypothetical protein
LNPRFFNIFASSSESGALAFARSAFRNGLPPATFQMKVEIPSPAACTSR